jgi:hypothetical protein
LEFFRQCPSCGRRFSVKVEWKELLESQEDTTRVVHDISTFPIGPMGKVTTSIATVADKVPIERETFRITYVCGHCKHGWSEEVGVVKKIA